MHSCHSLSAVELTPAHILNIYREAGKIGRQMTRGTEYRIRNTSLDIFSSRRELTGASVGLVGFGGIGQYWARMPTPFQYVVSAGDPFISDERMAAPRAFACRVNSYAPIAAALHCAPPTMQAQNI